MPRQKAGFLRYFEDKMSPFAQSKERDDEDFHCQKIVAGNILWQ